MPIPTYDQFIEPLLRYLVTRPEGVSAGDAHEAVATRLGLTPDQRAERLPSGVQHVYKNRNGWAQDRLKRAELSTSPRYGFWQLTPAGFAYAASHPTLSEDELERLSSALRIPRLKPKADVADLQPASAVELVTAEKSSPEERIEAALTELRDSVARDLLELIGRAPPEFFESLVLDLLHAMGYGTNRTDLQRVGGSGDGGIDRIISLDRLGLEKSTSKPNAGKTQLVAQKSKPSWAPYNCKALPKASSSPPAYSPKTPSHLPIAPAGPSSSSTEHSSLH